MATVVTVLTAILRALHAFATMFALRVFNNGPRSLIFADKDYRSGWKWMALLLFATTFFLQFTSTVLVTDLGFGQLALPLQGNSTFTGLSLDNTNLEDPLHYQSPYWTEFPTKFPAFDNDSTNLKSHR
ncbi:hypothetical protein F4808DRAFT_439219 [Astrocystis sublimbata]|nr:hypothetical protein F4808DRAFT_439219 [Astrocystis sublimbata]